MAKLRLSATPTLRARYPRPQTGLGSLSSRDSRRELLALIVWNNFGDRLRL
jgi:hypothetical protein